MKIIINIGLIFLIGTIISCSKNNEVDKVEDLVNADLPACIEEIIIDSARILELRTIQVIDINNELHYWLNTDSRFLDGSEFFVNEQCDTVCGICGFCFPIDTTAIDCLTAYDFEDWKIIWKP